MEPTDKLKSELMNHFARFDLNDDEKDRLIIELDALSNLLIDSYLEYNIDNTK